MFTCRAIADGEKPNHERVRDGKLPRLDVRKDSEDRVLAGTGVDVDSVAGQPGWKQHQFRILDETLRWIETFDQPGSRRLVVELETQVEAARGER